MNTNSPPPFSTALQRQIFFLLLLLLLVLILFFYLSSYLSGFLGALVLYILLRPLHFYFTEKKRWKAIFSVLLLFASSFAIMLLPLWIGISMISSKVAMIVERYEEILELVEGKVEIITELTGFDILSKESISKMTNAAARALPGILSSTLGLLGQIAIMYLILFFMLSSGRKFESWVKSYSPFSEEATQLLLNELKNMTFSNAIGIPLLGMVQAIFAGLGYWFFGVDEPVLWAILTGVFSVVPVVGTTIVWIPLSVFMTLNGEIVKGSLLFLYGALIIANIDNLVRFGLQKMLANVHPLITFLGVLIGLEMFGFTGIIFGPLLISYFLTLLNVYRKEYSGK
jgi:predicted PurR-regulated permease PerM